MEKRCRKSLLMIFVLTLTGIIAWRYCWLMIFNSSDGPVLTCPHFRFIEWGAKKKKEKQNKPKKPKRDNCHCVTRDCRFYGLCVSWQLWMQFSTSTLLFIDQMAVMLLCWASPSAHVWFCGHPAGYFHAIILLIITKWFISSSPASVLHSCSLFRAF